MLLFIKWLGWYCATQTNNVHTPKGVTVRTKHIVLIAIGMLISLPIYPLSKMLVELRTTPEQRLQHANDEQSRAFDAYIASLQVKLDAHALARDGKPGPDSAEVRDAVDDLLARHPAKE